MLTAGYGSFYGAAPAMNMQYGSFYGTTPLVAAGSFYGNQSVATKDKKMSSNKSFKSQKTSKSRKTESKSKLMFLEAGGDSGGFKAELLPTTVRLTRGKSSANGTAMRKAAASGRGK